MASIFDTTRNLSLYAVPAAWVLAMIPKFYAAGIYNAASSKQYNAISPRSMPKQIAEDQSVDQATKDRFTRAESASSNGHENLALFATALVAGNAAGLEHTYLNTLSGLYLLSRVAYTLIYINNTTPTAAKARSASFLVGVGIIMTTFVSAAKKFTRTL